MNLSLKMKSRSVLSALVLLSLAACSGVGPKYQRPSVQAVLPVNYQEKDSAQATQAPVVADQNQWWTLFGDAQLNTLMDKAFANNTNVQVAVARMEEADAQMREVGAALLPSVTLNSGASRSRVTEAGAFPNVGVNPRNDFKVQLNSSVEIDFWGKLRSAKDASRANYLNTYFAQQTVQWSLASSIANQYVTLRSLDSQLAYTANSLTTAKESLKLTERRLAGGVSSGLDVSQARLVIDQLLSQQLELQRLRAVSEHQLGLLTGDLGMQIQTSPIAAMPELPVPPAGLPSSLMEARPDVRQAEQTMIAANANIGIAKAALYPSVSLTGALGGQSLELSNILKSAARIWTLGLDVSLPIFSAGKLQSRVDQATAKQKQALASYAGTLQTAFTEVNDALSNGREYRAREAVAQSQKNNAARILEISENRYKAGYSGYIEVLDAQRSHNEALLAWIQSRQNALLASVATFKALGAGWKTEALTKP